MVTAHDQDAAEPFVITTPLYYVNAGKNGSCSLMHVCKKAPRIFPCSTMEQRSFPTEA